MRYALTEAEHALANAVLEFLPHLKRAEDYGLPSCEQAARQALVNRDQHDSGCLLRQLIYRAEALEALRSQAAAVAAEIVHGFQHLVGD